MQNLNKNHSRQRKQLVTRAGGGSVLGGNRQDLYIQRQWKHGPEGYPKTLKPLPLCLGLPMPQRTHGAHISGAQTPT